MQIQARIVLQNIVEQCEKRMHPSKHSDNCVVFEV